MKERKKITVQSVDAAVWSEVQEIHAATGVPYGRLVTKALEFWLASLDPTTPIPIRHQPGARMAADLD